MTRLRFVGFAALLLFVVACGTTLSRAKTDFRGGKFADAKDKLIAIEGDSVSYVGQERAEYVLYRGLVHHALGDRESAITWLREAKAIEAAHPRTLTDPDRARLDMVLESLGPAALQGP